MSESVAIVGAGIVDVGTRTDRRRPRMAQEKEGGSGEIAGPHTIETWIEGVDAGWPAGDVGRMIIHGLPRSPILLDLDHRGGERHGWVP